MSEKISQKRFADAWMDAYENDLNMTQLAEKLGESLAMVSIKAKRMREAGVPLPKLKRHWKSEQKAQEVKDAKNKVYERLAE